MELLTEKQRKNLKAIFKGKTQTPEIRMAKSRILKELRSKGIPKFIKNIMGDLELLTLLYYEKPVTATFVDLLIMEAFENYPTGKLEFLFHSAELHKNLPYKTITKEFDPSNASADMLYDTTQIGTIYRLLHEQLEISTIYTGNKYLTQKEIKARTNLPKATVSRLLKELINEELIECESSSSPLKYCCKCI